MIASLQKKYSHLLIQAEVLKSSPNRALNQILKNRGAIRSYFDGHYKFSRYFSPTQHNQPKSLEQILALNDIELYDLKNDPHEMNNLAAESRKNGEIILAMNEKMNQLIEEEVGEDNGSFLPGKNVNWAATSFDP